MRGSIICIAIFCFSYVSTAPTDEDIPEIEKEAKITFKYEDFDVINSFDPFWKDEVIYAICEGSDAVKKCALYVRSSEPYKYDSGSCALNLTYSRRYDFDVALYNVGSFMAVFALKEADDKIKLISVNMTDCEISEATLKVAKVESLFEMLEIIPHANNYDVILRNSKECMDGLCKSTYDFDGNLVKAASKLPAVVDGFQMVKYAGQGSYVFAKYEGGLKHDSSGLLNVYLVKDGDDQNNISPVVSIEITTRWGAMSLSTEENKIAVCSYWDGKMICKQIHVDDKSRTINTEIPFNYHNASFYYLDVLNLEKGLLQASVGPQNLIKVTHFDEEGKLVKSVDFDTKCEEYHGNPSKIYKNTKGQYCVNSVCMALIDADDRSNFTFNNRCFDNSELF